MSETRPLFLGPRLRRLRREMGLTQAAMAEDLGISPSYVALIEHNQRPVTADLLLRIARGYRLDLGELAGDDGADTARRLTELLRDPVFAEIDLPALEVADLAASFPGASEALVRLYGAYTRAQAALAEAGSGGDAAPEPVTEARRFIGRGAGRSRDRSGRRHGLSGAHPRHPHPRPARAGDDGFAAAL